MPFSAVGSACGCIITIQKVLVYIHGSVISSALTVSSENCGECWCLNCHHRSFGPLGERGFQAWGEGPSRECCWVQRQSEHQKWSECQNRSWVSGQWNRAQQPPSKHSAKLIYCGSDQDSKDDDDSRLGKSLVGSSPSIHPSYMLCVFVCVESW